MGKQFEIEVTVPEGLKAGDTFVVAVEAPAKEKGARGILKGIALVDMTDDELKRELINSKSVLYKALQRGSSAETIAANQARVDAAVAEKAKRAPVVVAAVVAEETDAEEEVSTEM